MKYNGQNIIADSDIVMTGQQAGHNLLEVINQHSEDISNLKGNVKWIYKYGGVSSGSGGGGGSDSSAPWNFRVEIDDVARESGTVVNLGQLKEYKLAIQLYKVLGRTFTIKYSYNTELGIKVTEKVIPPTASSLLVDTINLQINGNLAISISDDEGNYDQFILDYIVTAYTFDIDYVYADDKSVYYPENNNIFVTSVNQRGLLVRLTNIISVDVKSYYIEYLDWSQNTYTIDLDANEKYFYFDLGLDLTNDNSGNYEFIITPHLILKGNSVEEPIERLALSDNLIPDTIYLKVEVDGSIYKSTDVDDRYEFYAGVIPFLVTAFLGFKDETKPYALEVWLNGELLHYEGLVTELQDLKEYTLKIQTNANLLGWNEIKFIIARKDVSYEAIYYFYTKSPLGSFNWYPKLVVNGLDTDHIYPEVSYLYLHSNPIHLKAQQIPGTNSNLIQMSASSASKLYTFDLNYDIYKSYDCLLSIGLNYNKLNDIRNPIVSLSGKDSSYNITIYQNQIQIFGTMYTNFYFPMDGLYHLIDIYRRATSNQNNNPLYEIVVYLDGVMELVLPGYVTSQERYNTINLYAGLYSVNYLEISYFKHTPISIASDNILELYNPNPTLYALDFLTDSGILYHYYSYKLTVYPDSISDDFKNVYEYVMLFYNNTNTGRIEVNRTMIDQVASNVDIPVLLIKYTEAQGTGANWSSDGSNFMSWMEKSYDITVDTGATDVGFEVDVEYSKGKLLLTPIDIKTKFKNAYFKLFLQGTSTLNYIGKNFDLAINSPEEEYTYLYSPNFNDHDYSTFLPETRFTIKADVVDSSHSNNNAIGKFVNAVTTKFEDAKLNSSKYGPYLKNTLEGFPVLLFLLNSYYVNSTVRTPKDDFYFLGISNFNLGRDSEFNLGFKDLRLLPDTIENGFAVTRIDSDVKIGNVELSSKEYLNKLGVMEIRENRNYFDFSQSHPSVLFQLNSEDPDYMFSKFKSNNLSILKNNIEQFVHSVRKAGGYVFDSLLKNMVGKNDGDEYGYGYDEGYKTEIPRNIVPNYKIELERTIKDAKSVLTPTGVEIVGNRNDFINALIGNEEDGIAPAVDYTSLSEYYVICMALGLLDSVLKNMNFRKWGDKFYLAFYDMDTSLGKDNAGHNSDYLCFSDYWEPVTKDIGGYTSLEPALSYKDWYKRSVSGGYDIPSSYLFALAKYGYHFIQSNKDEGYKSPLEDWYPQNVWARFRRKDKNIPGWTLPSNANSEHIGCLSSADMFIDRFFANHLHKVPDVLFNFNYRAKYLQIQKEARDTFSADHEKFSGRRIHYVRDWLNSRFHLLDLYFNIARVPDSVLTYNMNTDTWSSVKNTSYATTNSMFVDRTNKDILVLQDAFASNDSSTKYSNDININFTAETYSPLSLSGTVIGRYITKENTLNYLLKLDSNGKAVNLGGSGSWLTLSSINTLLQGEKMYINSDKLTTLKGNSGKCTEWFLNLPSLKTVELNSSLYSGTLRFSMYENWPNLSFININKSKIGLNLDNVPVKEISAKEVGPADELILTNCNNLTTLDISKSIFTKITMLALKAVTFFSEYTYEKDDSGVWKKTATLADSAKCKYLSLKRTKKDGVIFIDGLTYTNNGVNEGLTSVTLEGYLEIYINNCPYLSEVYISDPSTVKILHITNSGSLATSLSVGKEASAYTINLSNFSNLQEVNFSTSKKFYYVYLPNRNQGKGVKLVEGAFTLTPIQYLSGTNILLSAKVFNLASSFTLLQNDQTSVCSFDSTQNIQDVLYLFYMTKITLETFTKFNNTYRTLLSKLTNTTRMWSYSTCVTYNEDYLLLDYITGKSRFDLSMYTNVTNASGMMGGKSVTACHPGTLKGLGSNSAKINLENFYGWNAALLQTVTIPLDWLKEVKTKVYNCNTTYPIIYKVVEYKNNQLQLVKLINPKNLFLGNTSNLLESLQNWVFYDEHIIDFKDAFTKSNFPKLTTITKSFVGCLGSNLEYELTIGDSTAVRGFLYSNLNIKNISGSFGFTNYDKLTVALDTYLDWATLSQNSILYLGFKYEVDWDEQYNVMQFNKTVGSVGVFNAIYNCLIGCYKADSLSHVFLNCLILDNTNTIKTNGVNLSIKKIPYLFSNLTVTNDNYLNWDWDIINTIPNAIDFKHAFEKNKYRGSIPFNFFKRRKADAALTVYLKKDDDTFENVELYTYNYGDLNSTNKIENLSYCFYKCRFETPTYIEGSEVNILNKSRLLKEGTVLSDTTYYPTASIYTAPQEIFNSEFDDIGKETAQVISISEEYALIRSTTTYNPGQYSNYAFEYSKSSVSRPVIPTDFFYGCTDSADLSYCFAETNLQGYIPDNLLKNCASAKLDSFLKGTLIFPKKYQSRYNNNLDMLLHIYYYIGSNFCSTTNLNNAFNFRIHLPASKSINENPLHVFCFSDSFSPDITSIKDALPKDINEAPEGYFFSILHLDHYHYLNMMYDKATERTTSYALDSEGNEITTDENGNPIELKPIIGNLGFELSKYKNLQADGLVNELFSLFIYGNVFDEYTTLESIKKNNSWVIKLGNSSYTFGISKYAMWPSASGVNPVIYAGSTVYNYNQGTWSKGDNIGMKMYEDNIMNGYSESVNKCYNNSRTNYTGYSIQFIK